MSIPNLLSDPNATTRNLDAAEPFYVSGEDALESNAFNTAAGVTLAIVGRMLLTSGEIIPFAFSHTPNTAGTRDQKRFPLSEGFILNAEVSASAGAPTGNSCIVLIRVVRGTGATVQPLGVLLQGSVTVSQEPSWPPTLLSGGASQSIAMPGTPLVTVGTNPAAGAEISETVPAGKVWLLCSFKITLVASATVANRVVTLELDDGVNVFARIPSQTSVTAGQSAVITFSQAVTDNGLNNDRMQFPIGTRLILGAGFRIRTNTLGLQVGDDYGSPIYLVEQFTP